MVLGGNDKVVNGARRSFVGDGVVRLVVWTALRDMRAWFRYSPLSIIVRGEETPKEAQAKISPIFIPKALNNEHVTNRTCHSVMTTKHPSRSTEEPRWKVFQNQKHSLRVPVSEIAACVGFHPYRDLVQLAIQHVYQGSAGQELLRHDAALLGVRLESDEEMLMDIAHQAGKSTQQALKSALQVQSGQKRLASVEQARKLCESVVQKARESKKLSEYQIKKLQQGSRHSVNTGFGSCWESQALDLYALQYGCDVRSRNEEIKVWPFTNTDDKTVKPMGPAYNFGKRSSLNDINVRETKRQKQDTSESVRTGEEEPPKSAADLSPLNSKPPTDSYFFSLRGSIDGIRDELVPNIHDSSDDDSWIFRPVIVECKHRMNRLQDSPPLYEMIQIIAYCQMYEVKEADLVQVLRKGPPTKMEKKRPKDPWQQKIPKFATNAGQRTPGPSKTVITSSRRHTTTVAQANNKTDTDSTVKEPASDSVINESRDEINLGMSGGADHCPPTSQNLKDKEKATVPDASNTVTTIALNLLPVHQDKENIKELQSVSKAESASRQPEIESETKMQFAGANIPTNMEISVSRISLDDPLHHHGSYWATTILPRLRSWVDGVYSIRTCDEKRYKLLMSSATHRVRDGIIKNEDDNGTSLFQGRMLEQNAWGILFEECPWLLECDTRYTRELR